MNFEDYFNSLFIQIFIEIHKNFEETLLINIIYNRTIIKNKLKIIHY